MMEMKKDLLLERIIEYIIGKIQLKLETSKVSFEELTSMPPEFAPKDLEDPIRRSWYQKFQMLKETYKKPVALAILYFFERVLGVSVEEIYFQDLVAGDLAWNQGISGRDIDYIVVVNVLPPPEKVKQVEEFLDNLVGEAITNFFWKKGLTNTSEPFNKIINHNLVEIHVIRPEEKPKYGLVRSMFMPPVEKADVKKYRQRILNAESILDEKFDYIEKYL